MKLCWEFLAKLRLSKPQGDFPGGKFRELKGVPGYRVLEGEWEFMKNCKYCGNNYMRRKGSKIQFCDVECKKAYTKWCKEWEKIRRYKLKINRKKLERNHYREYRKNYYKDYYKKKRKNNPFEAKIENLLRWTKRAAKRRNFEHNLDKTWLRAKLNSVCERTGLKFDFSFTPRCPFTPSIDRVDNAKGYTRDNCQMVVYIYNLSKNEFTDEDLYKMCVAFIKQYDKKMKLFQEKT